MNVSTHFNLASLKTKALSFVIKEGPCLLLVVGGSYYGLSTLNHNPYLEFGVAVVGSILGQYIGDRLFSKSSDNGLLAIGKRYGVALCFGMATLGAHQYYLHDHLPDQDGSSELHDCDHAPHQATLSFAPYKFPKVSDVEHNKSHQGFCRKL